MTSARMLAAAVVLAAGAAEADTLLQVDGAVNLSYTAQTHGTDTELGAVETTGATLIDLRPGIAYQVTGERVAYRASYVFAGAMTLSGDGGGFYSNHVEGALISTLSTRTTLALTLGMTQGGTAFQLTQKAADAGQPMIRTQDNPDLVNASLGETLRWEAAPSWNLGQTLTTTVSTPQDALDEYNLNVVGSLALDHGFQASAIGLELRSSFGVLRPVENAGADSYISVSNALLAHYGRDFTPRWNASATAGIQQVITFAGSEPLAFLPTGGVTASYFFSDRITGGLSYSHGATTNLQTGTASQSDTVVARGHYSFGSVLPRSFSASAGFLHSAPLGQASVLVAGGVGDAVQVDAGLSWSLSETVNATARYSLAYQFDTGKAPASLAQVVLVGLTAHYASERVAAPQPTLGTRVDGQDATAFPGLEPRRP